MGVSAKEKEEECTEEGVKARARNTAAVPSSKEVDEHNLDHAVFRSWCPHCVKGRAESSGHWSRLHVHAQRTG